MRASLRFTVEVEDEAQLTRLRDEIAETLDVPVTVSASAIEDLQFTVFGSIRGMPDESWRQVIRAQDAAEAKAKALGADARRTVVVVLSGDVG